jgi:subtilisin family serine protease
MRVRKLPGAFSVGLSLLLSLLSRTAPGQAADEPPLPGSSQAQSHAQIVVTFANQPLPQVVPAGSTGHSYAGGTYGLAQTAREEARRIASKYRLRQVNSWPIRQLAVHCVVYEIPDSRSVDEVLLALSRDTHITLAQPLQQFHTLTAAPPAGTRSSYNDPLYGLQSNLVTLGISSAHARSQGAGVRIALIDTGVDLAHPDLRDRIATHRSFVTQTAPTAAWSRHGTAMAGLIAAVANNNVGIVGIAPQAEIAVFQACWQLRADADDATCTTFTLAQALAAALDAHVPLVNLSLAGPADPLLSALIASGLKQGVIFVGSTAAEPGTFPTNIPGVIGVTASENQQPGAALVAPAVHVLTLRPAAQYDFESGSSVAAAEVTGMAALLLGESRDLTASSIITLLRRQPLQDGSNIDVNSALARLAETKSGGRVAATQHN